VDTHEIILHGSILSLQVRRFTATRMALVGYSKWAIRITFHPCAVSRGPIISTKTRGIGVFK